MFEDFFEFLGDGGFFIVIAIVMLSVFWMGGCNAGSNGRQCLKLGYRDSTTTWLGYGQAYCITRNDQTDIVVPLEEAKAKGRR